MDGNKAGGRSTSMSSSSSTVETGAGVDAARRALKAERCLCDFAFLASFSLAKHLPISRKSKVILKHGNRMAVVL